MDSALAYLASGRDADIKRLTILPVTDRGHARTYRSARSATANANTAAIANQNHGRRDTTYSGSTTAATP